MSKEKKRKPSTKRLRDRAAKWDNATTIDVSMIAASATPPCPHGRPTWRMCPHCLGIAFQPPPKASP